ILWQISDHAFCLLGLDYNIDLIDPNRPTRRPKNPNERLQKRALPSTIWTEESEDLARADIEGDIVHSDKCPVMLRQTFNGDLWHVLMRSREAVRHGPSILNDQPRLVAQTIGSFFLLCKR